MSFKAITSSGFGFDSVGNRTQLTYPDSKSVTYDYDPANRLVQVTDWDLSVTGYDYDDADRLVSITRPNLVTSTYGYDAGGQLLSLSHAGAGGTLSSFDYTYDGVGNRVAVTETFTSTVAIAYTYDPLYRLTAADYSDLSYFHYTYDAVGNRLSYEITGSETITYTYDIANRMASAGGVAYTWDDNGNLLNDGENTYGYNSANRLISVTNPQVTLSNVYNGLGDRIQQTVDSVITTYTLDLAVGLTQVLSDENNTYLYGLGRIGEEGAEGWQFHHGDALGSVRQLTDANGIVTLSKGYRPYGEVLNSTGSGSSSYGFTGEMTDDTGLIYLRARYMDPEVGRFLTKDTWQENYTRPLSLNGWNYVEGNSINRVDPSGQISCRNDADCQARAQILLNYAKVIKQSVVPGNLLTVEGFAKFIDFAMWLFNNDISGLMWGTTNVLLGVDPNEHLFVWFAVPAPPEMKYGKNTGKYFIEEDWLPYRNDPSKNTPERIHSERGDWASQYWDRTANQAYHFWFSVATTFYNGAGWGRLANIGHDPYFLECLFGNDLEKLRNIPILGVFNRLAVGTSQEDYN